MPKIFKSKLFTILLISALILPCLLAAPAVAAGSYPYTTSDDEVADALAYLSSQQGTDGSISDFATSAWAVMAIAAAGEDPDDWKDGSNPSIVDYLETNAASASSAGDYSRMILAIAAADEDPTDFGERNFVSLLEGEYDGTQIGDDSYLNDDFWGVMALVAAGEDPTTSDAIQDSVSFILANQNDDDVGGGWGYAPGAESDVDDTAAAIMALISAGEDPATSETISDGLDYIKSTQMENGGFPFLGETNSASDSWGICAIVAAGEDPIDEYWESEEGDNPVDDLLSFQNPDGSFDLSQTTEANQKLWTSYAIPALLGVPYPVAVLPPQEPEPEEGVTVDVRIEGQDENIWSGSVTVTDSTIIDDQDGEHYLGQPTVLGALDEASQEGEFPYAVQDTAYGLYLYSIDSEEAEGMSGWMYRVDYISPLDSVDQFILNETHQEVLFYYGDWMEPPIPLKVEVDNTTPDVDETFTVTVTEYDDDYAEWSPTEDATVYADTDYTTDENGEVEITIDANATVEVYAEKDGYIRSNQVTVIVGEGSAQPAEGKNVTMTVDIIPAISFSVTPDYINFGLLGPRDISPPVTIKVTNEGAWKLLVTAMVSDNAEDLYVDGLKLDNVKWDEFKATVSRDKSEEYVAILTVPETYRLTGNQNGTIIFWASEAP